MASNVQKQPKQIVLPPRKTQIRSAILSYGDDLSRSEPGTSKREKLDW